MASVSDSEAVRKLGNPADASREESSTSSMIWHCLTIRNSGSRTLSPQHTWKFLNGVAVPAGYTFVGYFFQEIREPGLSHGRSGANNAGPATRVRINMYEKSY